MESWCIDVVGNIFFGTELTLRTFKNPLFPSGFQEISVRRRILFTDTLYILHPYKQTTEHTSKRASQQAGLALIRLLP